MVNLRYSGPVDTGAGFPETVLSSYTTTDDNFAAFYFGTAGTSRFLKAGRGVDTCSTSTPGPVAEDFIAPGSLFFFISEDDLNLAAGEDQLQDAENLWVTVGIQTGNVNIAYNIPQLSPVIDPATLEETPLDFLTRLTNARDIARSRQTASQ